MPAGSPDPEEEPEEELDTDPEEDPEEEPGEELAAEDVKGALGCRSTLTELVVGWIVRRSSPATTSTSSGGRTARVITTGANAGAGLGTAAGGGVRGLDFVRA
jgi:hypothetical protein